MCEIGNHLLEGQQSKWLFNIYVIASGAHDDVSLMSRPTLALYNSSKQSRMPCVYAMLRVSCFRIYKVDEGNTLTKYNLKITLQIIK